MWRFVLRTLVVLICYGLCAYGFGAALFFLPGTSFIGAILAWPMLGAWAAHLLMSWGWIVNRKVPSHVPIFGTLAAIVTLLLYPFLAGWEGQDAVQILKNLAAGWAMGLIFFFPGIALAVYLCRFHLRREKILHIVPIES